MIYTFQIKRIKTMADNSYDVTLTMPEGSEEELFELIRRKQAGDILVLEDISGEVAEARDWETRDMK